MQDGRGAAHLLHRVASKGNSTAQVFSTAKWNQV